MEDGSMSRRWLSMIFGSILGVSLLISGSTPARAADESLDRFFVCMMHKDFFHLGLRSYHVGSTGSAPNQTSPGLGRARTAGAGKYPLEHLSGSAARPWR